MMSRRLSPKSLKKQLKMAMQSFDSSNATEADLAEEGPAEVPVFMLPRNNLSAIPEDGEIFQGFSVRLSLKPHQDRRYSGLMSLSNLDKEAIERSATTELEFRSYCRPARATQANRGKINVLRPRMANE
jgi:hypothetical protein